MPYDNFNISITQLLKNQGFIPPQYEDEVELFEKNIKKHNLPPIPENIDGTDKILQKGYSNTVKILPITNNKISNSLARAARQGGTISQSVIEKMKADRENSKDKK